ncbi:MAG TPA: serine/threonine-protein kinase, partial [Polyangiales bacterium]|nr:serine/threonine-protein kinase [Polyangiales bacterium]
MTLSDHALRSDAGGTRMLGRYQLRARLGAGGMGTVYRAWDPVHEREVALKLLLSSETASSKRKLVETLFEREYHELARLKHPNIVGVYDYGVDASGPYYTMELLAGHDLRELSPLPYAALCLHLRDLASALALLHAHGFVHRDVSSRNVRLDPSGRVKLIDFGALAPFGIGTNIVGTASCMAPETLHRMPLDQRADLFALGVLGYAALTGVQPFPARELSQLPLLWARPPAPPSALVRDVPPALDALILSMISVDRLARPSSAAAVIERLNAIGQLPAEPHDLAAENYLLSGAMVGRERERESWQRHVADARDRRGAAVLISGAHGLGKTRLLHELCLDAELKGMLVLKADAQAATAEPFGAAFRLGAELLTTYPEPARRAAEPFAGLLTPIFPELTSAGAPGVAPALMPSERSARIQRALHEWFVRVSTERPVCLAVDNAHALDPSSASLLATLARAAPRLRMLILATERSEDARSAEESLHVCRSQATLLKLLPLSLVHCEQLVGSQFGDVPNAKRLARTLYDRSGGHPQHCIELAQSLVSKRIATYHAGTWILPAEVQSHELPSRVGELIDRRLAAVSGTARELAEVLSVDGSPVSLERCVALMSRHTRREVFDALSDLVAE